jgi:hypothetical protein
LSLTFNTTKPLADCLKLHDAHQATYAVSARR